ncbi:hypothetical protein Z517_09628 [Fonsecaea pedrosoi CBS 271.37]|uniref:Methyltransferase type 12 domain-containing protein n=1 Tax=Fonsecaea pedrosoi CBS 271.37 TaxID=1442368 RepID=A0A0D2ESG3_9EURO|nr:uncharacterized protein Z517_09628 [Fonsecaea pedrosoi CBS 271.37]KIW77182.1 hypothetical protein Z517_09628 [Fonsecaea pedrosoi CBS 271.37]
MADITTRNREHFDLELSSQVASSHQDTWAPFIQAVIEELKERRLWISAKLGSDSNSTEGKDPVKLLDYACGSGTVSKALIPYVTEAVGVDLSANMVAEYNKWAEGLDGHAHAKAHAFQCDLLAEPQPTDPALSDFDIAVVCAALHHVADPEGLLRRLSKTLRPGGVCVVLDRVLSDERPELLLGKDLPESARNVLQTINKHGFTEEDMRRYFHGAGMGRNFEFVVIERPFKVTLFGQEMELESFMARGEVA